VQEYNLQTNNFLAEYGRNTGYIANASSRSGGNQFHGNAFFFNLNSGLGANSCSNNARNVERPEFNRNQFGATIGGPVKPPDRDRKRASTGAGKVLMAIELKHSR